MVDQMSVQMVQGQKITAFTTTRIQELEEKVAALTGKLEEKSYHREQKQKEDITELHKHIEVLEASDNAFSERLLKIEKQLKKQKTYFNEVLSTLGELSKTRKGKKLSRYDEAMSNYKRRRYNKAKTQLMKLLEDKKIKGNRKARIIHNLGMISFIKKDYENSLIYFGRLYTQYPKAPYNPNGLLYLGKSFQKIKKKGETKQTLNELVKRYPKSKSAKKARKILQSL